MQTYHKVLLVLLSAAIGTSCTVLLILYEKSKEWEESKLLIEDYPPAGYSDDYYDGIRRYIWLAAHGDYSKLKLIIRSEKKNYGVGDSVDITFFVRNDSDSKVHLGPRPGEIFYSNFWQLFHSNSEKVLKTPKGEMEFRGETRDPHTTWVQHSTGGRIYPQLQPGQECRFDKFRLSDYFDLTKPDTYELTCFLTKFIDGQYYESPLHSNTLTFCVLEESAPVDEFLLHDNFPDEYPDDMLAILGPFPKNPPKGEEVFKQTTPPKNVFYLNENGTKLIFIDESPTTYYRQRGR